MQKNPVPIWKHLLISAVGEVMCSMSYRGSHLPLAVTHEVDVLSTTNLQMRHEELSSLPKVSQFSQVTEPDFEHRQADPRDGWLSATMFTAFQVQRSTHLTPRDEV